MSPQQTPPATKSSLTNVDLLKLAILGIFLIIVFSIVNNWDDFKAGFMDGYKDHITRKS